MWDRFLQGKCQKDEGISGTEERWAVGMKLCRDDYGGGGGNWEW